MLVVNKRTGQVKEFRGLSNNKIYYRTYITERQSSEVNQTLNFETGTCVYTSLIKKCKRGLSPLFINF